MTLKEYFKTSKCSMAKMAYAIGVSEHAIHKWVYGQRAPHLKTALKIVEFTKGKVKLTDLLKEDREKAA